MTIEYIAVTLGVLLCVALLGIILLCCMLESAWRKYDEQAERYSRNYQRYMGVVAGMLAKLEIQIKEIAAGVASTDSEQ